MKKTLKLILLLIWSLNMNAGTLDRFSIKREYLQDDTDTYLSVSQNIDYNYFTAEYTVTRALRSYGLEKINWKVTLVATIETQSGSIVEEELSTPTIITNEVLLSQQYNDLEITGRIHRLLMSNPYIEIRLRCEYLNYSTTNGALLSTNRDTLYSSKFYVAVEKEFPNPYVKSDLKLFTAKQTYLRKSSFVTGGYQNFSSNWANVQGITSLNGFLYIVQGGNLHKVDPVTGIWNVVGDAGDWNGTEAITSSTNGYIYIIQNSRIHKFNPSTGTFQILGLPEWLGTEAMVSYGGYLYVVQNHRLHKVNENTGSYTLLGLPEWGGTQGIASSGDGNIYIIQNSYLHRVNANTGSFILLGGQNWANTYTKGMTFYNGFLYIIQNSRLHKVDKTTGMINVLGEPLYDGCSHLAALIP